jgi:hypothetical protein
MPRGRNLYLMGFVLSCASIAYRDMKKCGRLPWPPRFIYTAMVFILLDLFSFFSEELAGVSAIGFTLAIFVNEQWIGSCPPDNAGTSQPTGAQLLSNTSGSATTPYQQPLSASGFTTGDNQTPGQGGVVLA